MERARPWIIGALIVVGAGFLFGPYLIARTGLGPLPPLEIVTVPEYEPVEVGWLDQGWTVDDWQWYYHASQGGAMGLPIPYDWFINLEVGELPFPWWADAGRLVDSTYMARFGFLPNSVDRYDVGGLSPGWVAPVGSTLVEDTLNNPDLLPVGFVKTLDYPDRRYGSSDGDAVGRVVPSVVGFNCSMCHTGQLNYEGQGIRIEGGPAMIELGEFEDAVTNAMMLTRLVPARWDRFAERVLGPDRTEEAEKELQTQLDDLLIRGGELGAMLIERDIYPTTEGFARLDAVGRIGNFVLGEEIDWENFEVSDAPVNFPHIWDSPWFEWVQYNASFKSPMMRNAGEAMGVFAAVDFTSLDDPDSLFTSSLNIPNLYEMEALIRGQRPFAGLRAPTWPDAFPEIVPELAAKGDTLYQENCAGCHLPAFNRPGELLADTFWITDQGERYLRLNVVNLHAIGTDPRAAENMVTRTVRLGPLGEAFKDSVYTHGWVGMDPSGMGGMVPFGLGLPFVIDQAVEKKYADMGLTDELAAQFSGGRSPPYIQAPLGYKARPLNGVWATPPFLHNGSVPNIYQLLSPEDERDATFWLGTKEYDPEYLGYRSEEIPGGFLFDTSLPGNSNRGHHFTGGVDSWKEGRPGVIGRALEHEERMAIIEFLKSMPAVPAGADSAEPQAGAAGSPSEVTSGG